MKKLNLNRLEYFVAIAQAGTITAAADRMRVSKAVVSKQLQLLEEDLGATLVVRNSRHLNLTEIGQTFYEAAHASVTQADEAYELVRRGKTEPSGNLRITAPMDLGLDYIIPTVAEFRANYPAVTVDLTLSDRRFDPVGERFDIAFRVGWLSDSANIARKLADFQQVVLASSLLLDRYQRPTSPSELTDLPFIEHRALPNPMHWHFTHHTGKPETASFTPALSVDVTAGIKALVLEGAGIAIMPDFMVQRELENGTLISLISDWALPSGGIYSVYPPTQFRSAATQTFAELFAQRLKTHLA